jgi:hypothetical protein
MQKFTISNWIGRQGNSFNGVFTCGRDLPEHAAIAIRLRQNDSATAIYLR